MERKGIRGSRYPTLLALVWFAAILVAINLGGCSGCSGCNSGSGTTCSGTTGEFMTLNIGTDGNTVVYRGQYPPPGTPGSSCVNRVQSIQNTNAVALQIANGSSCSGGTPITLGPFNAQTNATQMMQLFGSLTPKLPISLTACGAFGANPPQAISLSLNVVTSTN
jgi:hypothetical protein